MDVCLLNPQTAASVEAVLGWRIWDLRQGLRTVAEMNYDDIRVRFVASSQICTPPRR
jgi:hypothetical protein